MSARTQLAAALKTALPKYAHFDTENVPDTLSKPTIVVRFRNYVPAPNAQGNLFAEFIVTVASPHTDPQKAEDDLDDRLAAVLAVLQAYPALTWSRAAKAQLKSAYLAFDITISLPVDIT